MATYLQGLPDELTDEWVRVATLSFFAVYTIVTCLKRRRRRVTLPQSPQFTIEEVEDDEEIKQEILPVDSKYVLEKIE